MSYAIQHRLHGAVAWPFHLLNVLLHAGASALVAELARRLTGSGCVALVAGLLFAAHPVHVEAVAYLVGRAESACAAGVLGAMVLATRRLTAPRALAIFACLAAAVLSKEQGLLGPFMVLGVVWARKAAARAPRPFRSPAELVPWVSSERTAARILTVLTLFAVSGYVAYREHILPWAWDASLLDAVTQPMSRSTTADRALIPLALFGRAVALIAAPVKLSPDYGLAIMTPAQRWDDPYLYLGVAAAVAFVAIAIIAIRRRARVVLLLLACAAISYGMVANVFLIGVVFAERLLYLPSAFLIVLAAIGVAKLPRRATACFVIGVIVLLGLRTVTYAARWNDRLGLYRAGVAENPRSVRLHVLLTDELLKRGDVDAAARVNAGAIALAPDYWKPWADAAHVAARRGDLDAAAAALERAWRLKGDPPELLGVEREVNELRRRGH
jgi:tetratricopeptide (TPR) repeat protein